MYVTQVYSLLIHRRFEGFMQIIFSIRFVLLDKNIVQIYARLWIPPGKIERQTQEASESGGSIETDPRGRDTKGSRETAYRERCTHKMEGEKVSEPLNL